MWLWIIIALVVVIGALLWFRSKKKPESAMPEIPSVSEPSQPGESQSSPTETETETDESEENKQSM